MQSVARWCPRPSSRRGLEDRETLLRARALAGMNEFMHGNYAVAIQRARLATAAAKVLFSTLLLAAALAQDGRRDEARQIVEEFKQRNPGFDSARASAGCSTTNADLKFVEGSFRIVATVRELGLP